MLKKEIIWREILFQAIEQKQRQFTQQDLAKMFSFSLSTVFNALKIPRQVGAIKVSGRYFIIVNIEKFLNIWGTHRRFENEIIYKTHVNLPVIKIEGTMPAGVVFTACTAFRLKFKNAPADYDKVYAYAEDLKEIKKRFPLQLGRANVVILKADEFLSNYGSLPPLAQVYADLWNLKEWYADDFLKALIRKII